RAARWQGPGQVGQVDLTCRRPQRRAEREGRGVSEQDVVPAPKETAPVDMDVPEESTPSGKSSVSATVQRLEGEGEIAADYIEGLLDIADLDGDIELSIDHGRALVEIITEGGEDRDLQRLVGKEGEGLDALQELTRLAVQARTGERSRLMLDIAGHRRRRKAELTAEIGSASRRERERN